MHSASPHAHALAPSPPGRPGEWAFGAGVKAITYVGRTSGGYLELGRSYYASTHAFGVTPGHANGADLPYPALAAGASLARCLRCHSTGPLRLGEGLSLEPAENGIGCEACHGPGARHIAAGGDPRTIGNPARLNAVELNRFCGTCHRRPPSPDDPADDRISVSAKFDWSNPWNVRQQPAYLSQSACFRASGGALSCLTCHNPHGAADLPPSAYDNRCAGCHWKVQHAAPVSGACVDCHMPRVTATAEMAFTGHWIGIYRGRNGPAPTESAHRLPPLSLPGTPESANPAPNDPATLRPLFDEALARARAQKGPRSSDVARSASLSGAFLEDVGDAAAAQKPLLEALSIDRANGSLRAAEDAMELGRALQAGGNVHEAIARFHEAARGGDARVVAQSYAALAKLEPGNAAADYANAVAAQESASGKDSPQVAGLLSNLALAVAAKSDFARAEALLRRALRIQNRAYGPGRLQSAVSMNNLATVLRREGRLAEAEALEREAVVLFERSLPNSFELAAAYANLADLVTGRDDAAAEAFLRRAIAADEAAGGAGSVAEAADLGHLAGLVRRTNPAEAVALFRKALSIYEARPGAFAAEAAEIRKALAGMEAGQRK